MSGTHADERHGEREQTYGPYNKWNGNQTKLQHLNSLEYNWLVILYVKEERSGQVPKRGTGQESRYQGNDAAQQT